MTDLQRQQVEKTPFRWMVHMYEGLKISNAFILELVSRWNIQTSSFRIREHLVPFSLLDVCVVLGLDITGEQVNLDDSTPGLVNDLFGQEDITVEKILLKLDEEDSVDNYYRLYILLLFAVFYFPRTSRTVCSFPFNLLDNLECLHMWNWGEAVHSYLVKTLDRASHIFRQQTNTGGLHLCGCVPVLQVCVNYI